MKNVRGVCVRVVVLGATISFIATNRSVHAQLIWKRFLQFEHHIRFEFAVCIDFSLDLLIFRQRFFDAVFCVQLWIFSLINVIEHFEWNMEILNLML